MGPQKAAALEALIRLGASLAQAARVHRAGRAETKKAASKAASRGFGRVQRRPR